MPAEDRNALAEAQGVAQRTAPIHSDEQLAAYLKRLPEHSPFAPLSEQGRDRFVQSLRFNEAGLTTFTYAPLVEELSASQARRLLALFGAERAVVLLPGVRVESAVDRAVLAVGSRQDRVSEDHKDYACVGRANCERATGFICMSGC